MIVQYPLEVAAGLQYMQCHTPGCLGNYDFERISFYARKRFIEGWDTISLLEQATSDLEKEEIAMVSLLDVEDKQILDLQLGCKYASRCNVLDCRDRLKEMISNQLERTPS